MNTEWLDSIAGAFVWRGYAYYKENAVLTKRKESETAFSGTVRGTRPAPYDVFLDLAHPENSHCDCPFADGKQIVCKHQIALFFSLFPEEAEAYREKQEAILEQKREEEQKQKEREMQEMRKKVELLIRKMPADEARQTLIDLLSEGPEWLFEQFVYYYLAELLHH